MISLLAPTNLTIPLLENLLNLNGCGGCGSNKDDICSGLLRAIHEQLDIASTLLQHVRKHSAKGFHSNELGNDFAGATGGALERVTKILETALNATRMNRKKQIMDDEWTDDKYEKALQLKKK